MEDKAAAIPAEVRAQEGDVRVKGPGGIEYAFTPDAAIETSDRLLQGGMEAAGQRRQEEVRRRGPGAPSK